MKIITTEDTKVTEVGDKNKTSLRKNHSHVLPCVLRVLCGEKFF